MPTSFIHYNILLSCPSDMECDKELVAKAVELVNNEYANSLKVHLDLKFWKKDVLFSYGTPQEIINNSIVNSADIVIALFGAMLSKSGEHSGTMEEIELMIKRKKQVFVCFSERDIILSGNISEQYLEGLIKVKQFKRSYQGLYISYSNDQQLIDKLVNQLRLYLNSMTTRGIPEIFDTVPFSYQEVQNDNDLVSLSKKIIFCARTGKIFLNGHYNQIKSMLHNGGELIFLTTENFDLAFDDKDEHKFNNANSLNVLRRLNVENPERVSCYRVHSPISLSMVYFEASDGFELLKIKFNFITKVKSQHPMFILNPSSPYFGIFMEELNNIIAQATELNLQ